MEIRKGETTDDPDKVIIYAYPKYTSSYKVAAVGDGSIGSPILLVLTKEDE